MASRLRLRGLWPLAAAALLLCVLPLTRASVPDATPAAAAAADAVDAAHALHVRAASTDVALLAAPAASGNGAGALRSKSGLPHTPSRFAWVLMHYEGTPKDDEYLLGLRVLIRSIQETKSPYDIVVITSSNVRDSTKQALLDDGALLNEVANLQNPFETKTKGRNSYKSRFIYSFNKLYVWAMVQYQRVVFLDSDNVFLTNMDEVFFCGHFCVVYMNPLIFHTGLIVVKPDKAMFERLLKALYADESFSHDGADQGFLVAQFDIEHAPLFLPAEHVAADTPSDEPAMRLDIGWNINHFWYYIAFDWEWFFHAPGSEDQYPWVREYRAGRGTVAGSSLAYCSGMMLKPWYWFPTFFFAHHMEWHKKRALLGIDYWPLFIGRLLALLPLAAIWHYLNSRPRIDRLTFLDPLRSLVLRLFNVAPVGFGYLYGTLSFLVAGVLTFQVIPYTTPPGMAWALWSVWHWSLSMMHLSLLTNICLRPTAQAMRRGMLVSVGSSEPDGGSVDAAAKSPSADEINFVASYVSGWRAGALMAAGQCVFFLSFLPIYGHFITKIACFEYWICIWIGLHAHAFRRATQRMCALLPTAAGR